MYSSHKLLHLLAFEAVDNSINEVMAGFAKTIYVTIQAEGAITVEDDGRGIPVDIHKRLSKDVGQDLSTLEGVTTIPRFLRPLRDYQYRTNGGIPGVGLTAVNMLCEWCEVETCWNGDIYRQAYRAGIAIDPVTKLGATRKSGTRIALRPNRQIFESTTFDYRTLQTKLRELAFLNSDLCVGLRDERSSTSEEFCYGNGITAFVHNLNPTSETMPPVICYSKGKAEHIEYEIALQFSGEGDENVRFFVNNIPTEEGGTHVSGAREGLTRALASFGKKADLLDDIVPAYADYRAGLTVVISLRLQIPLWASSTKLILANHEAERVVNSAINDSVNRFLEKDPKLAKAIVRRGVSAARSRAGREKG